MEDKLGKYVIRGILGKGAMGTVYDALDPVIDRRVAIKTLTLPDADDTEAQDELARFKREAQAAGRLAHPNIVGVFDYGETDTIAYIVMEFVDGPSLKSVLDKKEAFPAAQIVRIMEEVLAGLQFSHERGVVHRDIKPANIMLTTSGQVKIADFGIARIESSSMTQAGTIMGTPAYMSPEQFMGQTVDARTDLYSAGVVLYQMLTGERPFEGSMTAIMHKALNTSPPRPSELSVTAPSTLDGVVARAMGKRPEQRFATAAEFAAGLRQAFEGKALPPSPQMEDAEATMVAGPSGAGSSIALGAGPLKPPPSVPAAPKPPSADTPRSRAGLFAGVAAVALLAAGGGAWLLLAPAPAPRTVVALAPVTPPPASTPAVSLPDPTPAPSAPSPPAAPPVTPPVVATTPTPTPPALPPSRPVQPPPANPVPPVAAPLPVAAPPPATPPVSTPPVSTPPVATPPVAVPTQPAPTPPVVTAMVVPQPAQIQEALAAASANAACALLNVEVTDQGNALVGGVVQRGQESAVRRALAAASPSTSLDWQAVSFEGPYCRVLDSIRQASRRNPGRPELEVGLKANATRLRNNESVVPRLTMPDFPAYLQITYFASDGSMAHMLPSPQVKHIDMRLPDGRSQALRVPNAPDTLRPYPARAVLTLADPAASGMRADEIGWMVGEPFGRDLMLVVASSTPLFAAPRPADDSSASYLRDLQTAIDAAARKGANVNARVMVIEMVP